MAEKMSDYYGKLKNGTFFLIVGVWYVGKKQ
jgi:hypothetical protein